MEDFNLETTETAINTFIEQHELNDLIKQKTSEGGTSIHLILTNQKFSVKLMGRLKQDLVITFI